jgi:hypothetical protein
MREHILANISNPGALEKLYRGNRSAFRREFLNLLPELEESNLAGYWKERLTYESDEISWGSGTDFLFVVVAAVIAGLLAKLPAIIPINEEFFYSRNSAFLVMPFLAAYFIRKNRHNARTIAWIAGAMAISLVYINILPGDTGNDTLVLACIHLPLLLWAVTGVSYTGSDRGNFRKRLGFLRFNGDLAVMSALLVIAGLILTGISIGLFSIIGIDIEQFWFEYLVLFAAPAVPIMATHITITNPHLVNKVSPVIARIFSPIVLIMLVIYLGAIFLSGKDPYNDRDFLLLFNILLIGVMALIFFSVAETSEKETPASAVWVLLLLSAATVVVNGIALSAISFRISEWGITPNRIAVLGINILILIHLLIVTVMLLKNILKKAVIAETGRAIALYIPVYIVWLVIVVFLLPLFFGFR